MCLTAGIGVQTEEVSWWPKHSVWKKGGLNVGYWTPQYEQWFQMRCTAIVNEDIEGKGKLRTTREWGIALSFQNPTKKVRSHTRKDAEDFILRCS